MPLLVSRLSAAIASALAADNDDGAAEAIIY